MSPWALGMDTSNDTMSVVAWNRGTDEMMQCKKQLPVKAGELGLRQSQSEAIFAHTTQLGDLIDQKSHLTGGFSSIRFQGGHGIW